MITFFFGHFAPHRWVVLETFNLWIQISNHFWLTQKASLANSFNGKATEHKLSNNIVRRKSYLPTLTKDFLVVLGCSGCEDVRWSVSRCNRDGTEQPGGAQIRDGGQRAGNPDLQPAKRGGSPKSQYNMYLNPTTKYIEL